MKWFKMPSTCDVSRKEGQTNVLAGKFGGRKMISSDFPAHKIFLPTFFCPKIFLSAFSASLHLCVSALMLFHSRLQNESLPD
ncbi:MAG: hypothetical protein C5B50_12050 [Verrucomicrobia bacterium]|nr:MAG: hypothetical protein C5B50_12050 [Verrucomicrobiota bacterium]